MIFEAPDRFLADLISQMVNLQSLDISGTNLAGTAYGDDEGPCLHVYVHIFIRR